MGLQEQGLRVGSEVVKHVVSRWLGLRREQRERDAELTDMLTVSISDVLTRRKLGRQLEDIVDQVADRLTPLYEQEFRDVPQEERAAALTTVTDTLMVADLSDDALFAADVDPRKLASTIRARMPDATRRSALSEGAASLYDQVLDQCCLALVHISQQLPEFAPRASSEQLARLARLAEDIGEVLHRLPRTSLMAPVGTELDVAFRDRYLTTVSRRLDHLRLLGVDPQHSPRTRVSVAYLSLTVTSDGARDLRRGDDDWFADRTDQRERGGVRAEDALAEHRRTLLLGDAGLGKTTLLQWLGVHSARGTFTGPLAAWNGRVPFLIRLREHADGGLPAPDRFLHGVADADAGLMPQGWVHRQLGDNALLLVDGVDEVAPAQRLRVRRWLEDLVDDYPELPIVVTTRPPAVRKTWLRDLGFGPVLLERMGSSEVAEFVRRWHTAIRDAAQANPSAAPCAVDEVDSYEAAMLRQLDSAPHLRSLATTPLMCALLCAVNLSRHMQLPQDRMALYEVAVTMLTERRDTERGVQHTLALPLKAKLAILRDLAWWLTRNGRVEASRIDVAHRAARTLEQLLDTSVEADAAVEFLIERSGIIQAPAENRVDFVHRSFQEYLAAREAVDEDDIGILVGHAHLDQWRETVVMAAGHAARKQCTQLLTGLLDRADAKTDRRNTRALRLLAAACRETAEKVDPEVNARIDAALDAIVPPRSSRETRSLARSGAGVLRKLPARLEELSDASAAACVETAALINGPDALQLLASYATDSRPRVQRALVDAWRYFAPEVYAKDVLAGAPLDEGEAMVGRAQHVRWSHVLRNLSALEVQLDHNIEDLSFLDGGNHLTRLWCISNKPVDLAPLHQHGEIAELNIWGEGAQNSLEVLAQLKLLSLGLQLRDEPADLCPIAKIEMMQRLYLRGAGSVDLTPIRELQRLTTLGLFGHTTDPTALIMSLPNLDSISLGALPSGGVAALETVLPQLTNFSITSKELDTVNLALASRLRHLGLSGCPVSDIGSLQGLTKLFDIRLDGTLVTDLSPLSHLSELRLIDVRGCPKGLDLAPLLDLPQKMIFLASRSSDVRGIDSARERGHKIYLS
ncbi:NACHT domain-containing protein [Promicromonospora alba]|uniref:NACHT domain-containing protein n=1 Tax=Promicromonospora alba TaxID=1616110 RepID=A0ABV9HDC8_9MICO